MSDPKHTQKPWLVKPDSIDVFDKYGYTICEVYKGKEGIANRRLIAAAPDMMAALDRILEKFDDDESIQGHCICDARAAIAKAKGGEE